LYNDAPFSWLSCGWSLGEIPAPQRIDLHETWGKPEKAEQWRAKPARKQATEEQLASGKQNLRFCQYSREKGHNTFQRFFLTRRWVIWYK
jgi:hypothetical protein